MTDLSDAVGGKQRIVGGPFGSKLTTRDYTDEGVPVIRGSNMEVNGRWIGGDFAFVSDQKAEKDLKSNVAYPGDIMVTQRGTLGQVSIIPEDGGFPFYVVSQSQMAISVDTELVNRDFVYYFLRSPAFADYSHAQTIQTGVPHINLGILRDAPTSFPKKEVQREIATILGALDDKIELNRKTAATLEEMARALYRSWFVDFDAVNAKAAGRAPAHMTSQTAALFPDSFGDDGLPEGWRVQPLLEVVELLSGGTPKTSVPEFWNGDILWASAKDVSQCGNAFLITTERKITAEGLKKSSTKIIPKLSTVVVARGATTGRACMFGDDIAMNQTCYALRSRNDRPFFANCLFMTEVLGITLAAHGSVFDTITTKTLQAVSVVSPCEGLSEAFEREVSPMFNRILDLTRENQTLATLRDTLLPRLMSGELRVGEAKERVEEIV